MGVVLSMCICACDASDDEIVGEWKFVSPQSGAMDGILVEAEFNANHTGSLVYVRGRNSDASVIISYDFKWEIDGYLITTKGTYDKIYRSAYSGEPQEDLNVATSMDFRYKDDKLHLERGSLDYQGTHCSIVLCKK